MKVARRVEYTCHRGPADDQPSADVAGRAGRPRAGQSGEDTVIGFHRGLWRWPQPADVEVAAQTREVVKGRGEVRGRGNADGVQMTPVRGVALMANRPAVSSCEGKGGMRWL